MARFATTRWSLIRDARDPELARSALEEICRAYRAPVLVYVRRHGYSMVDAEDLTQDFFVRFLEAHLDAAADPARGHFRGLLLTALKRFLISADTASHAKKRGGGLQRTEHDDELDRLPARESESPEQAFERAWALTVLEHAFTRLRAEAERAGKIQLFEQLIPYVGERPTGDEYQSIAKELGLRTNTVAVAVHRLRTRLRALVREELADTCDDAGTVDAEMEALRGTLDRVAA